MMHKEKETTIDSHQHRQDGHKPNSVSHQKDFDSMNMGQMNYFSQSISSGGGVNSGINTGSNQNQVYHSITD